MSASPRRTYLPADERREQILDCALEVFARKGFHAASIADVCARARIARGTLYQYFTDKGAVLKALIDRIARRILNAAEQWHPFEMPPNHVWTEDDNVAFVEARCVQITSVVFADADTTSLLLRMARGTDFVRETMAVIDARVVALIEADVRAAMQAGALRMSDPRIIAQFIVGGIEKIVVTALDEGRQLDIARLAHEVAVLVSGGVVRRDAVRPPAGPGA